MQRIIYKIKVLILAFVMLNEAEDWEVSKWSKRLLGRDIIAEWNKANER